MKEISLLQDFCQRSLAAHEQMGLVIRTLGLEKDKKGEEVWSLKPAENHLLQGWAQEDGAKGRKGEVLVTMRGAGWTLEQLDAYWRCQCDGEALTE